MNRVLTAQETSELMSAIPAAVTMTRTEKLHRWADLIRKVPVQLQLYSNLERHSEQSWEDLIHPGTAFAVAFADQTFREAGLDSGSVGASMRFFELSRDDLHAFSCDCGGSINNKQMADRITKIADGGILSRAIGSIFK